MKRPLTILCFVVSTVCFGPYAPAQDSRSGSSVIAKLDLILKRIETIEKRLEKLEVALVGAPAAGKLSEKLPVVNERVRVITDKTARNPGAILRAAVHEPSVKGLVTLDGKVLPAIVKFVPLAGGLPVSAATNEFGRYKLPFGPRDRIGNGEYKVEIRALEKLPTQAEETASTKKTEVVPARYNAKSELSVRVVRGENVFDFELVSTRRIRR